jgi:hypothetical protein
MAGRKREAVMIPSKLPVGLWKYLTGQLWLRREPDRVLRFPRWDGLDTREERLIIWHQYGRCETCAQTHIPEHQYGSRPGRWRDDIRGRTGTNKRPCNARR